MAEIEVALHAHHAAGAAAALQSSVGAQRTSTQPRAQTAPLLEAPFAKVNNVDTGGPAEAAGLMAGDLVRRFGGANWMNHDKLRKVGEIVSQNEGVSC